MPVQRQNRPNAQWRGYDGTIASGRLAVGQAVQALPGGQASRIKAIHTLGAELQAAGTGQAVSVMLHDELDLARGDVLVADRASVTVSELVQAHLVWLADEPASLGARYELRLATCSTGATVAKVQALVDVDSLLRPGPGRPAGGQHHRAGRGHAGQTGGTGALCPQPRAGRLFAGGPRDARNRGRRHGAGPDAAPGVLAGRHGGTGPAHAAPAAKAHDCVAHGPERRRQNHAGQRGGICPARQRLRHLPAGRRQHPPRPVPRPGLF
jgi:hypothetical protein